MGIMKLNPTLVVAEANVCSPKSNDLQNTSKV